MDATDRCIKKLDDFTREFSATCDEIVVKIREIRRYNQNTMLMFIALWGIGLPAAFLCTIIWVARAH